MTVRRPFTVYILIALVWFQCISAVGGGIALLADPSGGIVHMPLSSLEGTPFRNYFIPGCILLLLLGVFPALSGYGLIVRPAWRWAETLNIYKDQYWAWTYALYLGIMLVLWIDIQVMLIGYGHFIQTFYALIGVAVIIITLLPSVKEYYRSV